jgi:branched-chain amino acid transport system ATP-binding protein
MAAATALLRTEDLVVHHGEIAAVLGVSLTVAAGEIVALIGPNGAGKSTLLNAICGPLRPTSGRILYADRDVTGLPTVQLVAAGIAHVPERRQIFGPLTVEDNLLLGSYGRRRSAPRAEIQADLQRVYAIFPVLGERRSQLAGSLSGGQQQMLAIGRGWMARPRLMLLDEPSLGLAPRLVQEIFVAIAGLAADGTGILLVEQNARAALQFARRAIVMEGGRIVLAGDAAVLRDDPQVRSVYFGQGRSLTAVGQRAPAGSGGSAATDGLGAREDGSR